MHTNLLAGVSVAAALPLGDVERIAARIFDRFGLSPGCDARDLAYSIGFDVCRWRAETRLRDGVVYYDERLGARHRDGAICRVVAAHVLQPGGMDTATNVDALVCAMTRKSSTTLRRTW